MAPKDDATKKKASTRKILKKNAPQNTRHFRIKDASHDSSSSVIEY